MKEERRKTERRKSCKKIENDRRNSKDRRDSTSYDHNVYGSLVHTGKHNAFMDAVAISC